MKSIKTQIKPVKTIISATLTSLILSLLPNSAHADGTDTDLEKVCDRQSLLIATEYRSHSKDELSVRDMGMLRIGAINGCLETYKKMANSPDIIKLSSSEEKNNSKKSQASADPDKESIFDRLLGTEKKEDISPMQKQHRTGGK